MRVSMIAGNWKMNTTVGEAIKLVQEMKSGLASFRNVEQLVCPPFVFLTAVAEIIRGSSIKLGAQNIFYEEKGAYTGEISPLMLAGLCEYVIIGHSERRQYFGETGEITNKKIKAAVKANLRPILCVGENLQENEAGKTEEVITGELKAGLEGIDASGGLVVAYEPLWAIGTGKAATAKQANDTIGIIRRYLASTYGG
ncbi:MAG: triose-phosphate isomerase, partial [Chloroflexota bacterium]